MGALLLLTLPFQAPAPKLDIRDELVVLGDDRGAPGAGKPWLKVPIIFDLVGTILGRSLEMIFLFLEIIEHIVYSLSPTKMSCYAKSKKS